MYKDLNHLNLTISDKLLGVASHFLQLFMPGLALWTYSSHASKFLLLGMKVSDCSAPPVPASLSYYVSKAVDISGSSFCLYKQLILTAVTFSVW